MKLGENIRQRSDGRFEARYAKGRNEDGSIKYGYCYGATADEAREKTGIISMTARTIAVILRNFIKSSPIGLKPVPLSSLL